VQRKKPGRKAEPPSKRRIAWPRWTGFRGMTVRDWLQLLIVPLVLVGIGLLFEMQQADRQQAMEEQQQALEERRAEAERNLAEQRAQDEALQAYLDQMSTLLLETDLRNSEEDSEVRTLARARTLTVLGRLDPTRKRAVMKFLAEARLIQRVDERAPIIRLGGADLHGTDLAGLVPAPRDALRGVDLNSADLSDADLSGNDLTGAILAFANLSGANLRGANLTGANVAVANLRSSDLIFANLTDADLSDADLKDAKLIGAEGMTREELEQQGAFLGGATMPYETVLPRGYYSAAGFQPALSLIFGQGWEESNGRPKVFEGGLDIFAEGTEGGQLSFTNLPTVFDPSNLRELKEVPAPESADEWVSWF
jgi:uncharacterized protein YjbI with pentapeptide repeats